MAFKFLLILYFTLNSRLTITTLLFITAPYTTNNTLLTYFLLKITYNVCYLRY